MIAPGSDVVDRQAGTMGSASWLDRAIWAIVQAPRELLLYGLVSLGTYAYLALLPGNPGYGESGVPWGWVLISAILVILLIRRVRLAWFFSLMLNILALVLLVLFTAWPWSLKHGGLVVLTAAAVVLLAMPAVRRYMDARPV